MRETRYNKKAWFKFIARLDERLSYQTQVKQGHSASKKKNIGLGSGKNGPPFTNKPSFERSKSAPAGFGGALEEIVDQEVIDSLKFRDKLSPDIWETESKIRTEVKEALLKVAHDFLSTIEINIPVKDIVLTGSLANYNWSKHSDLDVHIITDFSEVDDSAEVVESLTRALTSAWNSKHDIFIHDSSGVYSLMDDEWAVQPKKEDKFPDLDTVRKKAEDYIERIDAIEDAFQEGDFEDSYHDAKKLKEKIRTIRQRALKREGEYSVENLVFKVLRRTEDLDRLSTLLNRSYDMSITI
jgi:predicted nucleotidyltransferase